MAVCRGLVHQAHGRASGKIFLAILAGEAYNGCVDFDASVTQLVESHLAKVVVEGSNPFARSIFQWGFSSVGRASDS